MSTVTSKDGTQIDFEDWGPNPAQPLVFHHGWPLSTDNWDTQMQSFVGNGYRVVAHERAGMRCGTTRCGSGTGPVRTSAEMSGNHAQDS